MPKYISVVIEMQKTYIVLPLLKREYSHCYDDFTRTLMNGFNVSPKKSELKTTIQNLIDDFGVFQEKLQKKADMFAINDVMVSTYVYRELYQPNFGAEKIAIYPNIITAEEQNKLKVIGRYAEQSTPFSNYLNRGSKSDDFSIVIDDMDVSLSGAILAIGRSKVVLQGVPYKIAVYVDGNLKFSEIKGLIANSDKVDSKTDKFKKLSQLPKCRGVDLY